MRSLVVTALLLSGFAVPAAAQGVRGEVRITATYLDFLSVVRDSLDESLVPGSGITRELPDGTVVTCIPGGDCYWYRAGGKESATTLLQDLRLTAWPGVTGLSGRVEARGRFGSDDFWPRTNKEFEVRALYADFERANYRLRAGRQTRHGGLGQYPFDGGAFLWRGFGNVRLEAFAGRSLARTVLEPYTGSLIADSDALPPDKGAAVWGLEAGGHISALSGSLQYQREIRNDRAGLYSERMSADARWGAKPVVTEASADFDLATLEFNEAMLRARHAFTRQWFALGEVRHYHPFFELWTIWGAFSPVGYNEGRALLHWAPRAGLFLQASAAYRRYEATDAGTSFLPVENDGWRPAATAMWSSGVWDATASYTAHIGFGAFRSSLDVSGGRQFGRDVYLGAHATGNQQFNEFRFGDGRTYGAGLLGRVTRASVSVDGDVGWYRHTYDNRPGFSDETQFRGRLALGWQFGTNADHVRSSWP
jgi:hypothetical protein